MPKKVLFVFICYCVQWHWHDLSPVKWQSYLRDLVVGLIWTCFNTIHMIILGKQYLQRLNNAIWFFCQKDITEVYVGLCVYNCYPTWLTILFKLFSWVQCNLVFNVSNIRLFFNWMCRTAIWVITCGWLGKYHLITSFILCVAEDCPLRHTLDTFLGKKNFAIIAKFFLLLFLQNL